MMMSLFTESGAGAEPKRQGAEPAREPGKEQSAPACAGLFGEQNRRPAGFAPRGPRR